MKGLQSTINVTPLVDVVLVLLIILMVIAPLTVSNHDMAVSRESISTSAPLPEQFVLDIRVDGCPAPELLDPAGLPSNCTVRLNEESVAASALATRLVETLGDRPPSDRVLFLTADAQLNYEGVLRIVDRAKSAVDGLQVRLLTR